MGRFRGNTPIIARYRGSTPLVNRFRGSALIWTAGGGIGDEFTRLDGDGNAVDTPNTLGSGWTDLGPSADRKLGVEDGRARVTVPEGLLGGFWDNRISMARYNVATLGSDDGFMECRLATQGDGWSLTSLVGYYTGIFYRGSNSAGTHGVGIMANAGHIWIARRVSGVDGLMVDGGTFQGGQTILMKFVGNVHTLWVGGVQRAVWNDSGASASKGSGFRSLIIRGDGAKDLLGPRRFSPAIDYCRIGTL